MRIYTHIHAYTQVNKHSMNSGHISLRIYPYIYISTLLYVYIYPNICSMSYFQLIWIRTHVYLRTCTHVCAYVQVIHIYTCKYVCDLLLLHTCICIYIYKYIHIYIYIYMYIYICKDQNMIMYIYSWHVHVIIYVCIYIPLCWHTPSSSRWGSWQLKGFIRLFKGRN